MIDPGIWMVMAWQTGTVFTLRSMELWADPIQAGPRLLAHLAEKQRAMTRGAIGVTAAVSRGAFPLALLEAAMEPARRRVAANARGLARATESVARLR